MKHNIIIKYFLLMMLVLYQFILVAQNQYLTDPPGLKHWMTPNELLIKENIGKDFRATPPPVQPVRNIAEFDRMQGVLIRYPFGISYTVIKELADDVTVTTIVANQSTENTVRANYAANGINLSNCHFIHAGTNSYWTRDYGPWYMIDSSNQIGIVDFIYNRPRPLDDAIPEKVAQALGISCYKMDVIHTGGNYMTDGMGISASSELVWNENPSLSHEEILEQMHDYLGIDQYHVLPDPNNTYIDHIDCWGKFLAVDKILIRSVPATHPQYDEIEAIVGYWGSQTSSYGTSYEIFRVYTPNDQPYTNSLIINEKVLVPVVGSEWDDDALAAYQLAMPGYEIIGCTGSWESTDALHCRTIGTADLGMLWIRHTPISGDQYPGLYYPVTATIIPLSGADIYTDSIFVYYSVNQAPFSRLPLIFTGENNYSCHIPGASAGSEIRYYIYASDASGRREKHPFIGSADPHVFNVIDSYSQEIILPENWSAISSYLVPSGNIESIFAPVIDHLIIVNNGSKIYWPGQAINTLQTWDEQAGFFVKMNQPDELMLYSATFASREIQLYQGWNWLPVISSCETDIASLILDAGNEVVMIKEGIGQGIYWPEKGIQTLNFLIPGQAYLICVNNDVTLIFPECR